MPASLPNPTHGHNRQAILGFLGIPNAQWATFWGNQTLQNIYTDLRNNCQTFRQENFTTTMFIKPSYIAEILEAEADGENPLDLRERRHWEDNLQQVYAVKRICEELGNNFPVFRRDSGEEISERMMVMGVMVLCRVYRSCRGRTM